MDSEVKSAHINIHGYYSISIRITYCVQINETLQINPFNENEANASDESPWAKKGYIISRYQQLKCPK